MKNPILSVCIPTYNRVDYLKMTLENITSDAAFINSNDIEIIISDNCSTDDTKIISEEYANKFPDKIIYYRQKENVHDKNFIEALKLANGKWAKLHNDNILFDNGALDNIINILKIQDKSVIFFTNKNRKNTIVECKNTDELFNEISYYSTWIGGVYLKTADFKQLEAPDRFSSLKLAQTDIIARLAQNGSTVVNKKLMQHIVLNQKGGYNITEVFGQNYIIILKELINENLITNETYEKCIKEMLTQHISKFHFNLQNRYSYAKGGYFKYLFKYYKTKPYYYIEYIKYLIEKFFTLFFVIEKDEYQRHIKFFRIFTITRQRSKKNKIYLENN